MRLYDVPASPNCRKVRVLCRELALDVEIVPVDLSQPRAADYLDSNPTGKVPTLIDDDGLAIWESGAILIHLAEKRPAAGLLPRQPRQRSAVFRWLFFNATHLQPWISLLGQERILKPRRGEATNPVVVELAERELARFLPVLNDALAEQDFLVGNFTLADVALGCGLEGAELRGIDLAPLSHVAAWRDRLQSRVSWAD